LWTAKAAEALAAAEMEAMAARAVEHLEVNTEIWGKAGVWARGDTSQR
jgi:hypothetical protein